MMEVRSKGRFVACENVVWGPPDAPPYLRFEGERLPGPVAGFMIRLRHGATIEQAKALADHLAQYAEGISAEVRDLEGPWSAFSAPDGLS
jgi:hypothetical protein